MNIEEPNQYLERVRQKRLRNQEKLNELGLTRFVTPEKTRLKKKTCISSSSKGESTVHEPRRSSRVSKKPVDFIMLDHDLNAMATTTDDGTRVKATKTVKKKVPSRRKVDLGKQISPRKRETFKNFDCEAWVKDMEYYLSELAGNSDSNVQRVMCTVRKLVSGEGVRHPQTQEYFHKNKAIHLGLDFRQMLDEATEWVYENGGDKGNGWLIEHPVKKLWLYQQARATNNNKPFSIVKVNRSR